MLLTTTTTLFWDTDNNGWLAEILLTYTAGTDQVSDPDYITLSHINIVDIEVTSLSLCNDTGDETTCDERVTDDAVLELASEMLYWRHLCDTDEFCRHCLDSYRVDIVLAREYGDE
jgi:hypothetical protein